MMGVSSRRSPIFARAAREPPLDFWRKAAGLVGSERPAIFEQQVDRLVVFDDQDDRFAEAAEQSQAACVPPDPAGREPRVGAGEGNLGLSDPGSGDPLPASEHEGVWFKSEDPLVGKQRALIGQSW